MDGGTVAVLCGAVAKAASAVLVLMRGDVPVAGEAVGIA